MPDYDDWKLSSGKEDRWYSECEHCDSIIFVGQEYIRSRAGHFCNQECFNEYMTEYYDVRTEVAE